MERRGYSVKIKTRQLKKIQFFLFLKICFLEALWKDNKNHNSHSEPLLPVFSAMLKGSAGFSTCGWRLLIIVLLSFCLFYEYSQGVLLTSSSYELLWLPRRKGNWVGREPVLDGLFSFNRASLLCCICSFGHGNAKCYSEHNMWGVFIQPYIVVLSGDGALA